MGLSNAERQARWRAKRDKEIEELRKRLADKPERPADKPAKASLKDAVADRPAKPKPRDAAADNLELDRLRKQVEEFNIFLWECEAWITQADTIVKKRKGVLSRTQWGHLVKCLHPDTRKHMSPEELDRAFRIMENNKLALCDEQQVPTKKPKGPPLDWELRKRKVQEARKEARDKRSIR